MELIFNTDQLIADAVATGGNFNTTMRRIHAAICEKAEAWIDNSEVFDAVRQAIDERARANARARAVRFFASHDMNEYYARIYSDHTEYKRDNNK